MNSCDRLSALDGLRGLAILLVLFFHVWVAITGIGKMQGEFLPLAFLYAGHTGVTLFFLLSGFLVSRPFLKAFATGELPSLRNYALQRALRILPPYYVVGLLGLLITQKTDQFLPMLFFMAGGDEVGYFSKVWWSLSTEVQFYLLIPVVFVLALKFNRPWFFAAMFSLAAALYLLVIFGMLGNSYESVFHLMLSVIGQMPAFLIGAVLTIAYSKGGRSISTRTAWLILPSLFLLLAWLIKPAAQQVALHYMLNNPWYVLPESLVWGAIAWVMLMREPYSFSLLNNRMMRYFGKISFSLYLVHMPVVQLVLLYPPTAAHWLNVVVAIGISIALAQILYWLIEQPSLALKKRLAHSKYFQDIKI